jgi:hypothetical protein
MNNNIVSLEDNSDVPPPRPVPTQLPQPPYQKPQTKNDESNINCITDRHKTPRENYNDLEDPIIPKNNTVHPIGSNSPHPHSKIDPSKKLGFGYRSDAEHQIKPAFSSFKFRYTFLQPDQPNEVRQGDLETPGYWSLSKTLGLKAIGIGAQAIQDYSPEFELVIIEKSAKQKYLPPLGNGQGGLMRGGSILKMPSGLGELSPGLALGEPAKARDSNLAFVEHVIVLDCDGSGSEGGDEKKVTIEAGKEARPANFRKARSSVKNIDAEALERDTAKKFQQEAHPKKSGFMPPDDDDDADDDGDGEQMTSPPIKISLQIANIKGSQTDPRRKSILKPIGIPESLPPTQGGPRESKLTFKEDIVVLQGVDAGNAGDGKRKSQALKFEAPNQLMIQLEGQERSTAKRYSQAQEQHPRKSGYLPIDEEDLEPPKSLEEVDDSKTVQLSNPESIWLASRKSLDSKGRNVTPEIELKSWEQWNIHFASLIDPTAEPNPFLTRISSGPDAWWAMRRKGITGSECSRGIYFLVIQEKPGFDLMYMFGSLEPGKAQFTAMFASKTETGLAIGRYREGHWPCIEI